VLRVLNRELAANFDIDAFRHRAFWNAGARRIEMHLVSLRPQAVHVPRHGVVRFEEGETIRTEISCKYDRAAVETLFASAGLEIETWTTDARGWFALVVGRACR
jgi:L-histidine N-alpha-methyltransferase